MQHLIDANRRSAADFGWSPADFGAGRFDAGLVAAVQAFQADRILQPTGVVDRSTFQALQAQQELAELVAADERVGQRIAQVGKGRGDDAEIAPFAGVRLQLPRSTPPRGLDALPVDAIVCDVQHWEAMPRRIRTLGFAWTATRPDLLQRVVSQVEAFVHRGSAAVVLGLPGQALDAADADPRLMLAALDALQAAAGACPTGLALRIDPDPPTEVRKATLRLLRGRFTALLPFVPGDFEGKAPEPYLGQIFAQGNVLLQIRAARSFPTFVLDDATTPEKILRARLFLREKQHRGHGFSYPVPRHLDAAAFGDLPDRVLAIDPAPAAGAYHRPAERRRATRGSRD